MIVICVSYPPYACYCCCYLPVVVTVFCLSVDTYDLYVISMNLYSLYGVLVLVDGVARGKTMTRDDVKHATILLHYTTLI